MPYDEATKEPEKKDPEANPYKEELDLLTKMDDMFRYSLDHPSWVEARKDIVKCHEYKEGKQWTEDELDILKERHQPPSVTNLVSVTVSKLVGDLVDQRVRIGFRGRTSQDSTDSQLLSDLFLYVRQSNDLEYEEREMAQDGFTGGFGVIEAYPTFDDLFQPDIKVRAEDCLMVFPDPDSKRYDWNDDAKFICRAKWLDAEEAAEKYPKAKAAINSLVTNASISSIAGGQLASVEQFRNDNYVDQKRHRVRLIEVQYKKYQRECIYLFATGQIVQDKDFTPEMKKNADDNNIGYEKIDRIKPKICIGLYAAGILIDHKVTARKYFSMVPYFCYRKKNGAPYSLITLAISVQDAINKRESKALHLLSSNQTVAERGAIKAKEEYAAEIAKPDGIAVVEDGSLSGKRLMLRDNIELSAGQQNMYGAAINAFYSITGINPNLVSQTGEIRSGSGLKTKFAEASKPIAPIFDNLKRTRKILGRVILDLMQLYFTGDKVVMVTDDPKAASRPVTVTAAAMDKIKLANYDVTVDDFEDVSNIQQEQWALFLQYLPQLMQVPPFWQKKVIATSDLRDRDQLIKELEAMDQPPPLQPRLSFQANLQDLASEERAFMYELMGNKDLANQVRQAQIPSSIDAHVATELEKNRTDNTIELAKAKINAQVKHREIGVKERQPSSSE